MTDPRSAAQQEIFHPEHYFIASLEDEIRVDQLCLKLLKLFLQHLHESPEIDPLTAGRHARGADFFLRDYMLDHLRKNIFSITPHDIRGFAGNWYIVKTLEPNLKELQDLLEGIANFYIFCADKELIPALLLPELLTACSEHSFYQQRIETFHDLKDNEFLGWNKTCPTG
ncbi:MAG: hypothetical protein JXQ81_07800 [Desulfuromonadales bacterium]|nr:hypothetical protein [Desulfuromonadales bacterium]MBN2792391.1 hypothetical protein [Desulfuromonadales bacterium]